VAITRPLRSLRNRLALIFALIVLAAFGGIYVYVTPTLQERLIDQKLEDLTADAKRWSVGIDRVAGTSVSNATLKERVQTAATRAGSEVTLLGLVAGADNTFLSFSDSNPGGATIADMQSVAEEAVATKRPAAATGATRLGRMAFAAVPLLRDKQVRYVVVFSDVLADVQGTVAVVRERILVSGAVVLLIAVLAGYLVARALAARVERLEQAARKVAAGDFSTRIEVDSDDELGQLAAAFDDMQRQLARLDTARKQFIASASHELRTPIFSLGGFLELMADEDLDEVTRAQFLDQVRGQVERLRNLATELLDLSRLESGAVELRPEPTDLGALAESVAGEFAPRAAQRGTALELRKAAEPIELEIDPDRVAQVVRILLDNALVHTPEGTAIVLSAAREDGHARLEVSDTGLGIKRQTIPHIFEPFFSSDDGAQGAGLGLAIARELAGTMQGELTVHSTPGRTTFSLVLPA
jgi:two-component system, OmpR family, sensor kinase